ncbi:MAG: DegQ family serine endoprotease [Gammaproteobacteria bacterium]
MASVRSRFQALAVLLLMPLVLPVGLAQAAELPDFTELAERNSPAVVNISTIGRSEASEVIRNFRVPDLPEDHPFNELFRRFFGERGEGGAGPQGPDSPPDSGQEAESLGSGLIVSDDGYILTNNHVVEGATEILVRLSDRRQMVAELVGTDPRSDVALLKIDAEGLPTATIGTSKNLKVGEWVLAIGSPFGFDFTVTAGIISALGRSLPSENYVPFIQTDVAINPGNSGGPLFNLDGEVIGINSQIYSRTGGFMGLSFAIPIDVAMNVVNQLRDKGRVSRGWLGVLIQDVDRDLAESFGMSKPSGALVAQVLEDGPAARAGVQVGDVILEFDGKPVTDSAALPPIVGQTEVGKSVKVRVLRQGREEILGIAIGELPEEGGQVGVGGQPRSVESERLGLTVSDLVPDRREAMGIESGGVVITEVSGGPAARAGLQRGDVITLFDNSEVKGATHLRELLRDLPDDRKTVAILVHRDGGPMFVPLRLAD